MVFFQMFCEQFSISRDRYKAILFPALSPLVHYKLSLYVWSGVTIVGYVYIGIENIIRL